MLVEVLVGVGVLVFVGVLVLVGVDVGDPVGVLMLVLVGVGVSVLVGVSEPVGVFVGVFVFVGVGDPVGVSVLVLVGVGVFVLVGVGEPVGVLVLVLVGVGVFVPVLVGVGDAVLVGVDVAGFEITTEPETALPGTLPLSTPPNDAGGAAENSNGVTIVCSWLGWQITPNEIVTSVPVISLDKGRDRSPMKMSSSPSPSLASWLADRLKAGGTLNVTLSGSPSLLLSVASKLKQLCS